MSEVTEAAVTETPVVEVVAEAPKNAAEQRQTLRDRTHGVAAEANSVVPRDEKGRFAASNEPAPEAAATQVVADTVAEEVVQTPSIERVQIPDGHPLRDRGKQFLDELNVEEQRGLLNSATRTRDLQAAQNEARELKRQLAAMEAERGAWRENTISVLNEPEIALKYAELKEWNPAEAERWLRGVQAEYEQKVANKQTEVQKQLAERDADEAGRAFIAETYQVVTQRLPSEITTLPGFTTIYQQAMDEFDNLCAYEAQSGRAQQMTAEQAQSRFYQKHLLPALTLNPLVVQTWSQLNTRKAQMEQERVSAEAAKAAEAQRRKDAEAAAQSRNPMSRIPSTVTTGSSVPLQSGPRNAAEQRQRLRDSRLGR